MTEWQWVCLQMPWRVCELRRAEKDRSWNQIPLSIPLGDGIPTLMVGEKSLLSVPATGPHVPSFCSPWQDPLH